MSTYLELINNPKKYFIAVMASGWLDDWDDKSIDSLMQRILKIQDNRYLVYELSDLELDMQGYRTAKDYANLIKYLTTEFHLPLNLNTIKVTERKQNIISICIGNGEKTFKTSFTQEDEWLNDDILNFLNDDVLFQLNNDKIFYPLPPSSQLIYFVYQTEEKIEQAYLNGLIPDDDFFIHL